METGARASQCSTIQFHSLKKDVSLLVNLHRHSAEQTILNKSVTKKEMEEKKANIYFLGPLLSYCTAVEKDLSPSCHWQVQCSY